MKEKKSSNGLLRNALFITITLSFLFIYTPPIAAEKMARLVEIGPPEPAEGFELGCFDYCDEWIVWVESRRCSDATIVGERTFKVFRKKVGSNVRERLLYIPRERYRPLVFITRMGMVLIAQEKRLYLVWPNGDKKVLKPTSQLRVFQLFSDGFIAGIKQAYGQGKLVFYKLAKEGKLGNPIVLEDNFVTDYLVFADNCSRRCRRVISRSGTKVAWINGHPRRERANIVVGDIETGVRKVIGKGEKSDYALEIDGLYGKWLLCHQGSLARLIDIQDSRELQLPAPDKIRYFCPYGILFEVIAPNHCRFWDPVLQKRYDFLCDPATTFFSVMDQNEEFARVYMVERSRVSYFTTKDEMSEIPIKLLMSTAAAIKACMERYELDKDETNARRTWTAMFSVRWPYPPETIPLMESILNSYKDTNVRRAAAQRIGVSNNPAAKEMLLRVLTSEKSYFVREGILVFLGLLCDKADAIHIIEQQPRSASIEHAANTLGILGNPIALDYLQKVSNVKFKQKEEENRVRASVLNAIRYIKMRDEVEAVLKSLRSGSRN